MGADGTGAKMRSGLALPRRREPRPLSQRGQDVGGQVQGPGHRDGCRWQYEKSAITDTGTIFPRPAPGSHIPSSAPSTVHLSCGRNCLAADMMKIMPQMTRATIVVTRTISGPGAVLSAR